MLNLANIMIITCGLLCLLSCAVCFGFSIAIIAGVAYGYNYSLAEFLSFSRSDVTVYMRRGQFYDKPDVPMAQRRSDSEGTLFSANRTADYEDTGSQNQPLADAWLQSQDTRQYAEKLTRYTPLNPIEPFVPRAQEPTQIQPQVISIPPNPLLATVSLQSGSSEIVMRNYKPLDKSPSDVTEIPNHFLTTEATIKSIGFLGGPHKYKSVAESVTRTESSPYSIVPVRIWSTVEHHVIPEYVTEEIDEDSIVYKPV